LFMRERTRRCGVRDGVGSTEEAHAVEQADALD
jgi:hypothetical protein